MKAKTLLLTGFPRSGTYGTVKFNNLFGVLSYHQRCCPPEYLRIIRYKFDEPPDIVNEYIEKKIENLRNFKEQHFEASWDLGNYIYLLQKQMPELDFVISLRNPLMSCSSLLHYRQRGVSKYDVISKCFFHHVRMLAQIELMEKKPFWMDFKKYIEGGYTKAFFKYFGIENSKKNFEKAKEFLKKKLNHRGDYNLIENLQPDNCIYDLIKEIKHGCPEF